VEHAVVAASLRRSAVRWDLPSDWFSDTDPKALELFLELHRKPLSESG
jgi:hypothetical protein